MEVVVAVVVAVVLLGVCDLEGKGKATDKALTRGWDLKNTGAL